MRHLRSVLVAAVALLSTAARADQWEHNYAVSGKPEVVVNTNDGDVEVFTGGSEQVGVRVIARGWKINRDLKIDEKQSGNRVELTLDRAHKNCFGLCFESIRIEIHVPRDADLDIDTSDGGVRVEEVRGTMQVRTSDGDIRVRDVEGRLHADTGDGNLRVSGRFDLVNLRTGDGDIDADVAASSAPQPGWTCAPGTATCV